jgi:hypothetical protein
MGASGLAVKTFNLMIIVPFPTLRLLMWHSPLFLSIKNSAGVEWVLVEKLTVTVDPRSLQHLHFIPSVRTTVLEDHDG